MTYKMVVRIENPNTYAGMSSAMVLVMNAKFQHNPKTYGNGWFLSIEDTAGRFGNQFDLRYDKGFESDDMVGYLKEWAAGYWNGENGAYMLTKVDIEEVEA